MMMMIPFAFLIKKIVSILSGWLFASTPVTTNNNVVWRAVAYGNGVYIAVSAGLTTTLASSATSGNRVLRSTDGGVTWTRIATPVSADASWSAITYGNGIFVAVCDGAAYGVHYDRAMVSTDNGLTWSVYPTGYTNANTWRAIAYSAPLGLFAASGGVGNRIMTSPDGITWQTRAEPLSKTYTGIAWGVDRFVAVGGGTTYIYSTNGIDWSSSSTMGSQGWFRVTFGNGLFVAGANSGTGSLRISTSPDGITWTSQSTAALSTVAIDGIAWSPFMGEYIAGTSNYNALLSSPDGIGWTSRLLPNSIQYPLVAAGASEVIVVHGSTSTPNRCVSSTSVTSWASSYTMAVLKRSSFLNSIAFGGGNYIAVGSAETGAPSTIIKSTNGITWTAKTHVLTANLTHVAYGNGNFVAMTNAGIPQVETSTNGGETWTSYDVSPSTGTQCVRFVNNIFVAGLQSGSFGFTSTDGISWSSVALPVTGTVRDVAYTGTNYLTLYLNGVYYSTNYATFTAATGLSGSGYQAFATNGSGLAVLVGDAGIIFSSSNHGQAWTIRTSPVSRSFTNAMYSATEGKFYAISPAIVGIDTVIISSTNGTDWVLENFTAIPSTLLFRDIKRLNSIDFIVGMATPDKAIMYRA